MASCLTWGQSQHPKWSPEDHQELYLREEPGVSLEHCQLWPPKHKKYYIYYYCCFGLEAIPNHTWRLFLAVCWDQESGQLQAKPALNPLNLLWPLKILHRFLTLSVLGLVKVLRSYPSCCLGSDLHIHTHSLGIERNLGKHQDPIIWKNKNIESIMRLHFWHI